MKRKQRGQQRTKTGPGQKREKKKSDKDRDRRQQGEHGKSHQGMREYGEDEQCRRRSGKMPMTVGGAKEGANEGRTGGADNRKARKYIYLGRPLNQLASHTVIRSQMQNAAAVAALSPHSR